MKRVLALLTVALVMAAMMLAMGAQAFAKNSGDQPPGPPTTSGSETIANNGSEVDHAGGGGTCVIHFKGPTVTKQTGPGC
jgi:hypothetical protein